MTTGTHRSTVIHSYLTPQVVLLKKLCAFMPTDKDKQHQGLETGASRNLKTERAYSQHSTRTPTQLSVVAAALLTAPAGNDH